MKDRTKTYVLLTVVVLVWGIVGYKIHSSVYSDTPIRLSTSDYSKELFIEKKIKLRHTFTIHKHGRDPFLGTIKREKPNKKATPISRSVKPTKPEVKVEYAGMVKTGNSKEGSIFFVNINGSSNLMHIHDKISGIKLISGNDSEITIIINGKRKIVKK